MRAVSIPMANMATVNGTADSDSCADPLANCPLVQPWASLCADQDEEPADQGDDEPAEDAAAAGLPPDGRHAGPPAAREHRGQERPCHEAHDQPPAVAELLILLRAYQLVVLDVVGGHLLNRRRVDHDELRGDAQRVLHGNCQDLRQPQQQPAGPPHQRRFSDNRLFHGSLPDLVPMFRSTACRLPASARRDEPVEDIPYAADDAKKGENLHRIPSPPKPPVCRPEEMRMHERSEGNPYQRHRHRRSAADRSAMPTFGLPHPRALRQARIGYSSSGI